VRVLDLTLDDAVLAHEALVCPAWIDSHVYMYAFRNDLSSCHNEAAMHTQSSDWKRVIIIIIIVVIIIIIIQSRMTSLCLLHCRYDAHNLYGHSMARATYRALEALQGTRPFVLARYTCPPPLPRHMHRHADYNSEHSDGSIALRQLIDTGYLRPFSLLRMKRSSELKT
jgi:hypothetical protein